MKRKGNTEGIMGESTSEKYQHLQFGCLMKQFTRRKIVSQVLNLVIVTLFRVHTLNTFVLC